MFIGHGSRTAGVLEGRRPDAAEGSGVVGLHRGIVGHTLHVGAEGHPAYGHVQAPGDGIV